jgi:UDP-glucuronate decarboxylase
MKSIKNAIVTGGAGFIGSYMSNMLYNEGYNIIIIDNLFRGSLSNINDLLKDSNNSFHNLDLVDEANIKKLCKIFKEFKPQLILHYAAINGTQYFYDEPAKVATVNSIATYNILMALKKTKSDFKDFNPLFYFASTSEVYGEPQNIPTNENDITQVRIDMDRDSYAAAKLMSEFYVKLFCKEIRIEYIISRIFNVYGPKMIGSKYGQVVPELINRILQGEYPLKIIGDGRHTRSFCYINDHCLLTLKLLTSFNRNIIVNLGNPIEITIKELASEIFQLFNKVESFDFLTEREGDHQRRCPDIALLKSIVGEFSFTPLRNGLIETIEFYKKQII